MSISYYEDGVVRTPLTKQLMLLMLANCAFAGLILTSWTMISLFVVAPLEWATWRNVNAGSHTLDELLRYPLCILWLWPLFGVAGAWLSNKSGKRGVAYLCVTLPLIILGLMFGWFYLAPTDWH